MGRKWLSLSVLSNLWLTKIFSATKNKPDEFNSKLTDHAGSQIHAYISEMVTHNKYAFYLTANQKQLNKIQKLRLDCRWKNSQHLSRASAFSEKY